MRASVDHTAGGLNADFAEGTVVSGTCVECLLVAIGEEMKWMVIKDGAAVLSHMRGEVVRGEERGREL